MLKVKRKLRHKALHGLIALVFAVSNILLPLSNFPGPPTTVRAANGGSEGSVERIYGSDRYETAAKISQAGWKGTSEVAVLSAGMDQNLVDALAAAPLAKLKNAPILLTQGDALNPRAEAELKRLGVKTVYVTTGSKVITQKVLDRLAQLGIKVVSLGGNDRFETAINIAKEMGNYHELVVATAKSNADALSIAAIAAAKGMPILLSNPEGIPDQVKAYLSTVRGNLTKTYVLGGTGVLSDGVKNALPNSVRVGGADRFGTNIEILKTFARDLNVSKIYLANGEDRHLVDALAGAPLAAQTASPVLLSGKVLPSASKEYAKLNLGTDVIAFGGESVVPKAVAQLLSQVEVYAEDGVILGSSDASRLKAIDNTVKITGNHTTLKNAQVAYNVTIHGDHVLLDNVIIKGTLFVDPGEKGTATIRNVKANKIVVLSGAKDSIHLNNTEAGTLVVSSSSEVRVESTGSTRVGNTVVTSYAILDAAGGTLGQVEVVSVDGQAPVVTFRGTFTEPILVSGAATLRADANAGIARVEIAPEMSGQKVTLDGQFDSVVVNREAQVDLSAQTTVANMVTNAKAELNVPAGASIVALDKKGNDIAVTGTGSVGSTTPTGTPTGTAGGGGGGTGGGTGGGGTGGGPGGGSSIPVTGISVSPTTMTLTAGGETGTITATITPSNASNKNIIWSSSDTSVATVNSSGIVTPVAAGTATITAASAADNTKKASALVTVVEDFALRSSAFEDGDMIPIDYTMYGDNKVLPLQWNEVEGATNYALLMYDESTFDPEYPEYGAFVHWAVTGITNLSDILSGATQYTNSFGEVGYGGPLPPPGEIHTYKIVVYALNGSVSFVDDQYGIDMPDFEKALAGKIIKRAELTGTFAIDAISAALVPTGKVEVRENQDFGVNKFICREFELKLGSEVISLADAQLVLLQGYPLTPTTESALWIPINLRGPYDFVFKTHSGEIYTAPYNPQDIQKKELSFSEPTTASAVFFPGDEYKVAAVDFSKVEVEDLIDLTSLEDPDHYAITVSLDGIELNAGNVTKVFRIYDDNTIIEPSISNEFYNNAQYVTTKWQPGDVTMVYVLTDGTIVWSELTIEDPIVSDLELHDENGTFGKIKGTLSWKQPTIATGVDGYNIYFMDYWSSTIGNPVGSVPKGTNSFTISSDLKVPESAAKIGVVAYKMTEKGPEEYYRFAEIELSEVDNSGSTLPPTIVSVIDEDSNPGIDGRDFTVTWNPSDWAYTTLSYDIYIVTSGTALSLETLEDFEPIATITSSATSSAITWTGTDSDLRDSEGKLFAAGDYEVRVLAHSQAWMWLSAPKSISLLDDEEPLRIISALTFDDGNGILDSYLIVTNRSIDDSSLAGSSNKFKIGGDSLVNLVDTGGTENDNMFWVKFTETSLGTDAIPELTVEAGAFKDASGAANVELTEAEEVEEDGASPYLVGATVNGAVLTLNFSESLDAASVTTPGAFTVSSVTSPSVITVTYVEVEGNNVALTLSRSVSVGEDVTISYNKDSVPPIQDPRMNKVWAITNRSVTNTTEP